MRPLLTAELDAALLNDEEWTQWEKIMKVRFFLLYSFPRLLDVPACVVPSYRRLRSPLVHLAYNPPLSQSKKSSMEKKIEKLEKLYDDGFEDWIDEADEMEALGGGHGH